MATTRATAKAVSKNLVTPSVNDTHRLATLRGITREAWTLIAICAVAVAVVVIALAVNGDKADNYSLAVLAVFTATFSALGTFIAVMDWHGAEMNSHTLAWNVRYDIDGENLDRLSDAYRETVAQYATVRNERDTLRASLAIVTVERDALNDERDALAAQRKYLRDLAMISPSSALREIRK